MIKTHIRSLFTLFILLLGTLPNPVVSAEMGKTGRSARVALGYPAPDFEVVALADGSKVKLSSFRGEVVLINFWATWCAPCVEELPDLAKLNKYFSDEKFRVLAVNVDKSKRAGARFAKENKLSMPLYWTNPSDGIQDQYQATMLPASYIINQDGIIIAKEYGPKPWFSGEIKAQIADLLRSPLHEKASN